MRIHRLLPVLCCLAAILGSTTTRAYEAGDGTADARDKQARQYTFAWPYVEGDSMAPRGGTTRGAAVDLVEEPGEAWRRLRETGLSSRERDRRAILAMAGPYRTSFDFIETVGFVEGYTPSRPYQSWGTEYIYVVADEPEFISLQHILVMQMIDEEGRAAEPVVVKHWRQDWRYEHRDLHTYRGDRTWRRERPGRGETRGRWTQAVFQVDDTPRYQAAGEWEHYANYSSWHSNETWRPLPRREFSVRDDYQVLIGTNRHTITPTGWVQEEENLKVVLDAKGERERVLAREAGLARYERIENFDWSAGDAYWARTGPFWAVVREAWRDIFRQRDTVILRQPEGSPPLFETMFALADTLTATDSGFEPEAARQAVDEALSAYLRE